MTECVVAVAPNLTPPHPEERRQARLEGWAASILRDASLRDAPQDEAGRDRAGLVARMQRSGRAVADKNPGFATLIRATLASLFLATFGFQ